MSNHDLLEIQRLSHLLAEARAEVSRLDVECERLKRVIGSFALLRDVAAGIIGADAYDTIGSIKVYFDNRPTLYLQDAVRSALAAVTADEGLEKCR